MNVFEHPNLGGDWTCPICSTNADRPVTLISTSGTQEGHKVRARQFHVDCIELEYAPLTKDPGQSVIYTVPFRNEKGSVAGKRFLHWNEYLFYSIELSPEDPKDHNQAYAAIVDDGRIRDVVPSTEGVEGINIEEYLP